ncbi:MAG TPA: LysM peptidoglycan-binding domain-containing protein [Candidatus Baltobacteraceae bacterium]|nr:LysM peptidoglycan-binding domain-containing protein [Candidatus Baltobacteraceae bacterium]
MNSANPFQIPTVFQNDAQRRNRERFKKGVIASIIAAVLLLVGLLIQGCKSERSASVTPLPQLGAVSAAPQTALVPMPGSNHGVMPQPVPTVQKASMTPAISQSPTVYVVKSGDTLTRIARAHGISVKALKSVNDLASDQIVVGAKLKIPTA